MQIHCHSEHVLVEPIVEKMSAGGIAYIETDPDEQIYPLILKKGKVISVGPGTYLENGDLMPCESRVGQIVYYYSYATRGARGAEIEATKYDCIRDQDVFCRIEK